MPHRQFVDADGSAWAVWDVRPLVVQQSLDPGQTEDRHAPRRSPAPLDQALASGWLCFEAGEQKRRLAPIPPEWESLPAEGLRRLCESATIVRRAPKTTSRANGNHRT